MAILSRGERFKEARLTYNQHNKQTMKEVETATGVSASLIQALEDDENTRSVGYDKVALLAKHYGVTSDWLLCLTEDPALKPCAASELGLSPSVITFISSFWDESKQMEQDWLDEEGSIPDGWISGHTALNMLLDNPLMGIVLAQIAMTKSKVIDYSRTDLSNIFAFLSSRRDELGDRAYNYYAAKGFQHELEEKYPGIYRFIHITYGTDSLRDDIDEICNGFRDCVEEITGYKKLIAQSSNAKE